MPEAAERRRRVERFDRLSKTLDSKFRVLGVPVGWDSILGLVPGLGDLVTAGPGIAMIYEGHRMGARRRSLVRMAWNTGVDTVIGGIPLLGDAFDVFFKSHRRNARILQRELEWIEAHEAAHHQRKEEPTWQTARDRRTEAATPTRSSGPTARSTSRAAPAASSNAGSARATR